MYHFVFLSDEKLLLHQTHLFIFTLAFIVAATWQFTINSIICPVFFGIVSNSSYFLLNVIVADL
jgi:hypothetical protein